MSNSGNTSGGSGGSNHRRRNYRHFGPPGSASSGSGNAGQQNANRPPRQDSRDNSESRGSRDNREKDFHREQSGRPQQLNRPAAPSAREGGNQTPRDRGIGKGNTHQPNQQRAPVNNPNPAANSAAGTAGSGLAFTSPAASGALNAVSMQNPSNPAGTSAIPATVTAPVQRAPQNQQNQQNRPNQQIRQTRDSRDNRDSRAKSAAPAQNSSPAPGHERVARWEKKIKTEETYDDIKRENERLEKEIWLEIAGIHTIKLDM